MMGRQATGFTIIEVMLFMVISGAIFVIAATYMNSTIRDVRFQDGIKSVESLVERQYTFVQTNGVERPDLPAGKGLECALEPVSRSFTVFTVVDASDGASNTCVVLGTALHFINNRIEVYPVIGTDKATPVLANSLASARPTIYDGQTENDPSVTTGPIFTHELPWQATWTGGATPGLYMNAGTPTQFNTLAFLRAPDSESVNAYLAQTTYNGAGVVTGARNRLFTASTTTTSINQDIIFCSSTTTSGSMRGVVILDGAGGGTNNFSISSITSRILPSGQVVLGGMSCA